MSDQNKNVLPFPDAASIEAEAAEWVVRCDSGLSPEDYARFQEWQARSPHHREAAARLTRLWGDMDALKAMAAPVAAPQSPAIWHRAGALAPWLAAAAASIAVVLFGLHYFTATPAKPPVELAYQTPVGAQKTVALPDGSTMMLNTDTAVRVVLSEGERAVHLIRGEAYFEVVHDAKRPFAVFAGARVVRDIGTAFVVHLLPRAAEVTVVRGKVELAALHGNDRQHLADLNAGQNAVFDRKLDRLSQVSDTAMNRRLAWRQGVLVYAGEPLADVVKDFNRYSEIQLEVADAKLNGLQVGGYFEIGKSRAFIEALEDNFGIKAVWRDDHHVQLSAGIARR